MVRKMEISDYDKIYNLWIHTEGTGLRSLDDSNEGIEAFLKRNPLTNFVALNEEEIIGVILCGHDGRRGYIYHTVVKKDYRNQGIAKQLIEAAVSALKQEGITRVCLNVMESNDLGKNSGRKWAGKRNPF